MGVSSLHKQMNEIIQFRNILVVYGKDVNIQPPSWQMSECANMTANNTFKQVSLLSSP